MSRCKRFFAMRLALLAARRVLLFAAAAFFVADLPEDISAEDQPAPTEANLAPVITKEEFEAQRQKAANEALQAHMDDAASRIAQRERIELQQRAKRHLAIQSVSLEQYNATWPASLDVSGRPAREVLAEQFAHLQLPLAAGPEVERLLDRKVTLQCRGCNRLEIVERVCQQAGVYVDYSELGASDGGLFGAAMAFLFCPPTDKAGNNKDAAAKTRTPEEPPRNVVHVRAGKRPFPLQFSGPCAFEVVEFKENAPYGTGSLTLRVLRVGLHESVAARIDMEGSTLTRFQSLVDQSGSELSKGDTWGRLWSTHPTLQTELHAWDLKNLLRSATQIKITGRVSISIPRQVETVEVMSMETGASGQAGDCRMEMRGIQPSVFGGVDNQGRPKSREVKFLLEGPRHDPRQFMGWHPSQILFFDQQGRPIKSQSLIVDTLSRSSNADDPGKYNCTFLTEGIPARAVAKVFVRSREAEHPFQIALPLKHFAEQPLENQTLKFDGESPVSIEIKKFVRDGDFPEVALLIKNRSNKHIQEVHFKQLYLDASGKELRDFPGFVTGFSGADGKPAICVEKGKQIEKSSSTPFMPAETTEVRLWLERVKFMDGTSWNNPKERLNGAEPLNRIREMFNKSRLNRDNPRVPGD